MKKKGFIWLLIALVTLPAQLYNHSLEELLEDMKLYHYSGLLETNPTGRAHAGDLFQHSMWVYCATHNLFTEKSPYTQGLELTEQEQRVFSLAGILHDTGKAGRKELFDKTHPTLAYAVNRDANNNITSIIHTGDLEEHCTVGFENIASHLFDTTKQTVFSPRPYIMKTKNDEVCDFKDMFSRLEISPEYQKLVAILIGIHWSFGNVRRGLMTNESFLEKLKNLATAVDYEDGIISERTLHLAILINIADVKGLHPCCSEDTCLLPGRIDIPAPYPQCTPPPFVMFGLEPSLGKDCLGLIAMQNLLKYFSTIWHTSLRNSHHNIPIAIS